MRDQKKDERYQRDSQSYKTRFNPPFSNNKNACIYLVMNMTVVVHSYDVFELLILPFHEGLSALNFPQSSLFFAILLFTQPKESNTFFSTCISRKSIE